MRELVTNKRMLKVMWGCLFMGGLAAMIDIYRAAKNTESPAYFV